MATSPNVGIVNTFLTQSSQTCQEINDAIQKKRLSEEKKGGPIKTARGEVDITEHLESPEEVLQKYGTASIDTGLTDDQVTQSRREYGENTLTPPPTKHWIVLLWEQMVGFFSLLLWAASALCFFAYALDTNQDDYLYLGTVLALVTFATGVFSFYQEWRSNDIMNGFKRMMPKKVKVNRNGKPFNLDATQLVRGDVVKVVAGDAIPADLRVCKSSNFKVDNSSLTGESDAQTRGLKNVQENPMEATNLAFYGTNCAKGSCTGVVIRTGNDTLIGTIAHLAATTETVEAPIAIEVEHFIHTITVIAVILGSTFMFIGIGRGEEPVQCLVFMIGIIVANVPEGLLATVTVALSCTAQHMAKKNVLVKHLEAVETLGSTTCIASDKTGTLTQNRMTGVELYFDSTTYPISTEKERTIVSEKSTFDKALMVMALCNNAVFEASEENLSKPIQQRETNGDASESALLKVCEHMVKKHNSNVLQFRKDHTKIGEIPFNSTNKYQVSVHTPNNNEDAARLLVMKGAPERIWEACSFVHIDGKVVPKDDEHKKSFDDNINEMMFKGERVLGLSYAELDPEVWELPSKDANGNYQSADADENGAYDASKDDLFGKIPYDASSGVEPKKGDIKLVFCGLIALIDPPRPAVPRAVQLCQKAGIKVIMVTGDHPETAESIARKVNIIRDKTERDIMREHPEEKNIDAATDNRVNAVVIKGSRLANLTDEQLDFFLDYDQVVFARTSPAQKLKIVRGLQLKKFERRGHATPKPVKHIVAVTGDGVNDSPALKQADIGIAMGIAGTEVAKDAADMILLDDNFASIVKGVEEGRLIFDNLKKSIAYTLSSKIPEMSPYLTMILISIPLPLPTFLILCIDLGTDMVPAISLAYEGKEANIMTKPPRDARVDRLVTPKLICFAYLQIGIMQALAGFFSYMVVLKDFGFAVDILPGINWAFEDQSNICLIPASSAVSMYKDGNYEFPADWTCGGQGGMVNNTAYGFSSAAAKSFKEDGLFINGKEQIWSNFANTLSSWSVGQLDKSGHMMWSQNDRYHNHEKWQFCGDMTTCYVSQTYPHNQDCWNPNEALKYAQTLYFITIVIVQWSDIIACKTRTLSLRIQGMRNNMLNFGLFFETMVACMVAYIPFVNYGLNTRPVHFVHWLAPLPFAIFITIYDEIRKWLMRITTRDLVLFGPKRKILATPDEGLQPLNWVYRYTYY